MELISVQALNEQIITLYSNRQNQSKMSKYFLPFFLILSFQIFAQNATINFKILNQSTQQPMPAKIVILKNGESFHHNVESSTTLACRDNTIYSATGEGRFQIPAGKYEIWFGKGMEYSIETQQHSFEESKTYEIQTTLRKEINTDGFVCGDMHLHTFTFSGHGDATVEERLISCAAEGLEWAVSTDHNYVLDYAPYMKTLNLQKYMSTSIGNEVSTSIGHFNTYPLDPKKEKANYKIKDGKALFNHIREKTPKDVIIQVNHPRWVDSDYFNTKGLDPHFGSSKHPEWSWNFDAIEVLNETTQLGWVPAPDNKFSVKNDWINFQNRNKRITALGNSDNHSVTEMIAGVPRNYIASSTDDPSKIDESEIIQSIKNQKVSVSSGIFVNMTANKDFGIGEQIDAKGKAVDFHLNVQAASWISCDRVEFLRNGQVIQTYDIPKTKNSVRLDTIFSTLVEHDSWFMAIAYGDSPTPPILQIKKKPIIPKGFTNPIWVDADSNGKIESIYDFSIKSAPDAAFSIMSKYPETIPYIIQHLFETKNEFVGFLSENMLSKPETTTEQKLMIYRELSKKGDSGATAVLKSQQKKYLTPLEEVSLEWFLNFPLSNSRLDNFKEKQKEILDEQLSFLEREFLYVHSGAVKRDLLLWKEELKEWKPVYLSKAGTINFDQSKGQQMILKRSFFSIKENELTAYLRTNAPSVTIKNNGKTISHITDNSKASIEEKIIKIPLEKRWNEIQFIIENNEAVEFSFLPISNELILNEAKEIKEVKHLAVGKPIKYLTEYSPKYHGFGEALTDGLRGSNAYSSQLWQGWNAENMEVIIDLGEKRVVKDVKVGLLSNQGAWIFLPRQVDIYISKNGRKFKKVKSKEFAIPTHLEPSKILDVDFSFKKKAKFIKVVAHKLPKLPDWHVGAGSDGSWIFVDEILVY
jgi:hypothetical protein